MNKIQKSMSAIVAIVLLVTVTMITFAFKSSEVVKNNKVTFADAWYPINPTNDATHANQIINGSLTTQPTGPDCRLSNLGDYCAVKFIFTAPAVPPASFPSGTTVSDVLALPGVSIAFEGGKEVYTRQP